MAFRPEPTIYTLKFDKDTGLQGLHLEIGCCSLGEMNEMLSAAAAGSVVENISDFEKGVKGTHRIRDIFLDHLKNWDLENPRTGEPVPMTAEGVDSVEQGMFIKMIAAWHFAMMSVPDPLNQTSSNGSRSEETTLGLGNLSQSLQSSPTPN